MWLFGLWQSLKSNRNAQLIAIIVLAASATFIIDQCTVRRHKAAVAQGKQEQRLDNLQSTIDQVERANNASETIRRNPDARRDECLRDAWNPSDC